MKIMMDNTEMRLGVGIVVLNDEGQVLLCRRLGSKDAWQFPQGGIAQGESPQEAMYRELEEEVGLSQSVVELIAESEDWYDYYLPKPFQRRQGPPCVGQRQKWFLLRLSDSDAVIRLDTTHPQEFDAYQWTAYWYPLEKVIDFKRDAYRQVLREFSNLTRIFHK